MVECVCDIQSLCQSVIMSSAHCVHIVCCHLHIVCTLCVSFLSMLLFVNVIFVMANVNMLYGHCMPCHYVQCHMVIVKLWSISCGLSSYVSQNWSGVVVRSSLFLCNLSEVVFTFLAWVVFIFRLIMSTLVYEVMKVYLVKMSRCHDVKMSRCQDVKMSPVNARSLCAVLGLTCCTVIITTFKGRVKILFSIAPLVKNVGLKVTHYVIVTVRFYSKAMSPQYSCVCAGTVW